MKTPRFLALAPLQIAQALAGFGAIAVFTRLMSADEFGRYALALSISMAAHTLLFTWAEAAAFRFFTQAQAARRLADHYATLIAIAIVLGLATLLVTGFIVTRAGLPHEATTIAAFAAGAAMLRFITRINRENDRAGLELGRYAIMETAYVLLGFAAGVAFLVVTDLGPAAPFAGLVLGGAVILLVDAPRLYAKAKGGYATFTRAKRYSAYGAPLAIALVVDLGVQAVARIILAAQGSEAELGAYAAAFGLARPLDLVFIGLSAALAPIVFAAFEHEGEAEAQAVARRLFAMLAAFAIPACVGLVLVAEPLANLMVGESLRTGASAALPLLAVAALFSGFTLYYWSEAFQLTHRTGQRALLMLLPGAVQLALTLLFARQYGALGAAIGAAAGALVGCVALAIAGRRLFALPLPTATLARTLAATALMAFGLAALPKPEGALELAIFVTAGAALYAVGAVIFGVLDARERGLALWRRVLPRPRTEAPQ